LIKILLFNTKLLNLNQPQYTTS